MIVFVGTENVFPDEGINIVSVSIHTHTSGRNVKLSQIRNGREINRIVEDNYYNYNYQEVRQLANETKVLPGDFMILDCTYNTTALNKPTLGGYSLHEEICLSFITYYPKIELGKKIKNFFSEFADKICLFLLSRLLLHGTCQGIFRIF